MQYHTISRVMPRPHHRWFAALQRNRILCICTVCENTFNVFMALKRGWSNISWQQALQIPDGMVHISEIEGVFDLIDALTCPAGDHPGADVPAGMARWACAHDKCLMCQLDKLLYFTGAGMAGCCAVCQLACMQLHGAA